MLRQTLISMPHARVVSVVLLMSAPFSALAQTGGNSPNQFGDRQTGQWGDPGAGHFGNPAAGDFDKYKLSTPPPGTRPLGKVYVGKAPETSPYISLPTPIDAAAQVDRQSQAVVATPKKKSSKKRSTKKKAAG